LRISEREVPLEKREQSRWLVAGCGHHDKEQERPWNPKKSSDGPAKTKEGDRLVEYFTQLVAPFRIRSLGVRCRKML